MVGYRSRSGTAYRHATIATPAQKYTYIGGPHRRDSAYREDCSWLWKGMNDDQTPMSMLLPFQANRYAWMLRNASAHTAHRPPSTNLPSRLSRPVFRSGAITQYQRNQTSTSELRTSKHRNATMRASLISSGPWMGAGRNCESDANQRMAA